MKTIFTLLPVLVFSYTVQGQMDAAPQKTIDSVKAVQLNKQRTGTVSEKVIDGDALPLQKEQSVLINDNNKTISQSNSVNGNATDVNDKKVGGSTVRNPSKRGVAVAPTVETINRSTTLPTRSAINARVLDSVAVKNNTAKRAIKSTTKSRKK